MQIFSLVGKGNLLLLISTLEVGTPFARMLIITHFLNLSEVGFAGALTATYSMFELVTDFAISRFVFSAPRSEYRDALSGAQGLAVVRGLVVGGAAVAAGPVLAGLLSVSTHWADFSVLGIAVAIRSFENLAPRVAERDYHYGPQLTVTVVSSILAIAALFASARWRHDHIAIIMSLFAQMIGLVVTSHLVAGTPYRPKFRTPQFRAAFNFGYPLAINGIGLALSSQADRLLVGAMLGMSSLGLYSIVVLAITVSSAMIARIVTTFSLSALHNAAPTPKIFDARLRLAAAVYPLIFSAYAITILTMMNIVVQKAFGPEYEVSKIGLLLLGSAAFVRMTRGDPFASLLMHAGRTKRLAAGNITSILSLVFIAGFMYINRSNESAYLGRLVGELLGLGMTLYLSRHLFQVARADHTMSMAIGVAAIAVVGFACLNTSVGTDLVLSLTTFGLSLLILASVAARAAIPLAKQAFSFS